MVASAVVIDEISPHLSALRERFAAAGFENCSVKVDTAEAKPRLAEWCKMFSGDRGVIA